MTSKIFKYIFLIVAAAFTMAACKVTQPYEAPELAATNLYRGQSTEDTTTAADLKWTELFTDTILQRLISEGLSRNPDLQIAYTRIQQARAYYSQSKAAFLPSFDANAGFSAARLSDAQGLGMRNSATQYELGIASSWEADIWGKLKSSKKASLASLLQTEAAARGVQTRLVADIATYYYSLMALDQQLDIIRQTVSNWDTTVQTMRLLKESARVTEAAVVQSEAQRYAVEVTLPDLKQSIKETENALSILLGSAPSAIYRGDLESQEVASLLQTGVPAQLLANRPDVQEAELNFRYYFELTNVARTYFYPSLNITGSAGLSALSLETLFDPASFAASIGAGLTQPIFNRRVNKTRLEVAKAQQQEALLGFQNILLNAGREVSDAISLYETAVDKINIRSKQMMALRNSVDYSQELLENGFANYTEIITARQSLLQAELGGVNDHLQQLQAVVNLYRSLGGGWK
ncbi:efflux transporter outer membrane subunit [Agriterribacter sp.]|uniref:efflux transporter outer membrane subunit n=1 Tax=Agriterribacter sp. TaxID=2821509 RepID=UPI002CFB56D4|nr:efflux transporter outer membrane subunit [Agriterribacter sp.]HRP58128.1 efflux transporter outer membrane subunit [Agriterribacter sp.]